MSAKTYMTPISENGKLLAISAATGIPFIFWGAPGIGKTASVEQFARANNYRLITFLTSDKEASDLGGIPYPDSEKSFAQYLMNAQIPWAGMDDEAAGILFFLDEIDRTSHEVSNAIQQLLLNREINGRRLGDNVIIAAAANGETTTGTIQLNGALLNRCAHIYNKADLPGYLAWSKANGSSPLIRQFAEQNPKAFFGEPIEIEDKATYTPRSWEMAARLIQAAESVEWGEALIPALVNGCVGRANAVPFLGFRDLRVHAPRIDEILADPDNVRVLIASDDPEDEIQGLQFGLTESMIEYTKTDPDGLAGIGAAFARYGIRWQEEPAQCLFSQLVEVCPSVKSTAAYKSWEARQKPASKTND